MNWLLLEVFSLWLCPVCIQLVEGFSHGLTAYWHGIEGKDRGEGDGLRFAAAYAIS